MNKTVLFSGLLLSYLAFLAGLFPTKAATLSSELESALLEAPGELVEQVNTIF
ncbi:MAG: hypothetical protein F6K31_18985 [Symploca sp. SIO2G7]|nr:hypothetical protein [Symploca sp. SIO2G7]